MDNILEINRGDDHILEFTFEDEDGLPLDLTGKTVVFMIKRRVKDLDSDALYTTTIVTHSDPTNGKTTDTLLKAVTATWLSRKYFSQTRIVNADTTVNSSDIGDVEVLENLIE